MEESIVSQIMALKEMPVADLQEKYEEVFEGKKATSNNKTYLWRRIAYRIQELRSGGISLDAQNKIGELIKEYDPINNKALRPNTSIEDNANKKLKIRDGRLPIPGTIITKNYKGTMLQVKVLDNGFEYKGTFYKTLTKLAGQITGAHWSGYVFFGL